MSNQAHDLGMQKRKKGQKPMSEKQKAWQRAKRRHPGPLPREWQTLKQWDEAGRPKR